MLFPYPDNATTCLFECSDACDFYHLCRSPFLYAPPPLRPPPQQNPTSPIRLHHSSRLSLALVASASSLAAASLVLLLSCLLSLHLRRRRRRRSSASSAAVGGGGADAEGFVDEDGEVDHHVWYIRTVGLDEPTIGAIAVWVYQSGEGGVLVGGGGGGGGCAVCLAEFRDGELLRLLPKCGHAFHVACIDTWLRGHVNCPLCRAPIMAPSPAPAPAPADALPSLSPSLSPSSSSSSSDSTISDHDGSDSSNQVEVRGIEEGTDAGDVEIGGDNAIEVNSTVEVSSSSRVLSNSQSQDKV
ncbi:E3 ubiquitin-protein ligase RING1 [Ananas comosus]|uniref:RING-type E3 ubiquitin transferase n=1 Tax=Ananas comosus TaxID=4615 RepID=A0A199VX37_ANACO|nr:E3 ubiquitin-protein ligase RING1 [Ananas comosus]